MTACAREAVHAAGTQPAAIGLSGQMHGLVLTSPDGEALRPALLWPDSRAAGALRAYRLLGSAALARLANPLTPGMAGPLLMWIAEHEPRSYAAARWALQPKDWLRARLTGEFHAEPSDASGTLLYDVPGDRWDLAAVSALGLDARLLAPLLPSSGAPAGRLTPEAGAELGLPAGIPVAAGAADTAAARSRQRRGQRRRHPAHGRHRRAGHPPGGRTRQPGRRRGQPVPVSHPRRLVPDGRHPQRRAQSQLGARDHERHLGRAVRQRRSSRAGPTTRSSSRICPGNARRIPTRRCAVPGPRWRWPTTGRRCCGPRWKGPRSPSATRWTPCWRMTARRGCGWPAAAPWPPAGGSCWRTSSGCRCTPWTCPRRPAGARRCWAPTPRAC